MPQRACVAVAHPDDETLWFGGLIVSSPDIEWSVVCATLPRRDPQRADTKFYAACDALGVGHAQNLRIRERTKHDPIEPDDLQRLYDAVMDANPSFVVTHGPLGEYGHLHHIQLSQFLRARIQDRPVAVSDYRAPTLDGVKITDNDYGERTVLELEERVWNRKLLALKCYNHTTKLDQKMKWEALLERYGPDFNLRVEPYLGLPT